MEILSENICFGGVQGVYKHTSTACQCDMTFAVYMPPQARVQKVPVLWFLSGLTCTHENAMTKAGAQAWAAKYGVALVFPDTSPRGDDVANDDAYDLGQGAGFYVDAVQKPWAPHFNMWTYVTQELSKLVLAEFSVDEEKQGITGHSMGGHGALTIAMTLPEQFKSVSALAPIANPTASDWGRKQLGAYLGADETAWLAHDASLLMVEHGFHNPVLIDQGTADNFYDLLKPQALAAAIIARKQAAYFRMQDGYDHSYFFIQSVMQDHVKFHAELLK